ncbi:hypothetical protein ACFWN7_07525 [Agromyces sp. NPDC058484]|uniref:hypothetical protein n=1 Tax=Agromyces sp. NPDC058484 TaxID=3346524 RepID=UPI00364AABB2
MSAPIPPEPETISIDGKVFAGVENSASGQVGAATQFRYHQDDDVIWAEYSGGAIVRGYLVGIRTGGKLDFRYSHLNTDRQTANGVCETRIEVLEDGRVRFHEAWA